MRTALLLPALLVAACAPSEQPETLNEEFQEAASEYDVPRDLLVALAWSNTRLSQGVSYTHGRAGARVGIMGLSKDMVPSVTEAAYLVGVSPELLEENRYQNIRGGAAWLRDRASARYRKTREPIDSLSEWYPIVAEYSGSADPVVAEGYAAQVFDHLEYGIFATTPEGEYLEVAPQDLYWRNDRVAADDSGLVDQFVAASSSNYSDYSRTGADIDYIIVHTTQGSYSGAISWFQNSSAACSAHYVIRSSDGQVTQMVDEEDVAWHAGNWDYNLASVGIEHEGYVENPDEWYTDTMYAASAALAADIADRNGIPKDRDHILGHSEVPGATHTDPGSGWDWDYYMDLVEAGGGSGLAFDPDIEGDRSGSFHATVNAPDVGASDTCSGDLSGQVAGGQVYLTATCRLDKYGDKAGDVAITWTGTISGNEVEGRIVVDSYSDSWTGKIDTDGRISASMSGSKELGGDIGTLEYEAEIEATM